MLQMKVRMVGIFRKNTILYYTILSPIPFEHSRSVFKERLDNVRMPTVKSSIPNYLSLKLLFFFVRHS